MGKIGFLFPGQGAQYIGMGKELYENFREVREAFEEASDLLHMDVKALCFDEINKDELNLTKNTQPSILTLSYGILKVVENLGFKCHVAAGLSLGEYSALLSSKALSFSEGVSLVRKRGIYMQEAVPQGIGGITAVVSLTRDKVLELVKRAKVKGTIEVSNYNCPLQIAVGGEIQALEYFEELCKAEGAKKVVRLASSAPFHTSMLKDASKRLGEELLKVNFKPMVHPVVTNVTGKYMEEDKIRETLELQVKSTVLFEDSINYMVENDVDTFIELGPSRVLSGFIRKVDRNLRAFNVEDLKSLKKLLDEGIV